MYGGAIWWWRSELSMVVPPSVENWMIWWRHLAAKVRTTVDPVRWWRHLVVEIGTSSVHYKWGKGVKPNGIITIMQKLVEVETLISQAKRYFPLQQKISRFSVEEGKCLPLDG